MMRTMIAMLLLGTALAVASEILKEEAPPEPVTEKKVVQETLPTPSPKKKEGIYGRHVNEVDVPRPGMKLRAGGMICYFVDAKGRVLDAVVVKAVKNEGMYQSSHIGHMTIPTPRKKFSPFIVCRGYLKISVQENGVMAKRAVVGIYVVSGRKSGWWGERAFPATVSVYLAGRRVFYCPPYFDKNKYNDTGDVRSALSARRVDDYYEEDPRECQASIFSAPTPAWYPLTIVFSPYRDIVSVKEIVQKEWGALSRDGFRIVVTLHSAVFPGALGDRRKSYYKKPLGNIADLLYMNADVARKLGGY